jgi:hypothetical protein
MHSIMRTHNVSDVIITSEKSTPDPLYPPKGRLYESTSPRLFSHILRTSPPLPRIGRFSMLLLDSPLSASQLLLVRVPGARHI